MRQTNKSIILFVICILILGAGIIYWSQKEETPMESTQNTSEVKQEKITLSVGQSAEVGSLKITFDRVEPAAVTPGPAGVIGAEVFLETQYVFSYTINGATPTNPTFKLSKFNTFASLENYRVQVDGDALAQAEKNNTMASSLSLTVSSK